MKFWIPLAATVALGLLYPYFRLIIKRLRCMKKIKELCRAKGYRMYETGALRILCSNRSKKCDLYIETENEIFAIKLFGVLKRRRTLILKENRDYIIRSYIVILSYVARLCFPIDRKPGRMPKYDFEYKLKDEWKKKPLRRVLLINPVCTGMIYSSESGYRAGLAGDSFCGMTVHTASSFIELIKE